jgi:hypothetical protein
MTFIETIAPGQADQTVADLYAAHELTVGRPIADS